MPQLAPTVSPSVSLPFVLPLVPSPHYWVGLGISPKPATVDGTDRSSQDSLARALLFLRVAAQPDPKTRYCSDKRFFVLACDRIL